MVEKVHVKHAKLFKPKQLCYFQLCRRQNKSINLIVHVYYTSFQRKVRERKEQRLDSNQLKNNCMRYELFIFSFPNPVTGQQGSDRFFSDLINRFSGGICMLKHDDYHSTAVKLCASLTVVQFTGPK